MVKPEFNRVAAAYSAFRVGYSAKTVATIVRAVGPNAAVLDVGTGTGLLADQVRPHVRRVVGTDIALDMLRAARPPATQCLGERLPFRDASFDGVTCAQAFHWLDRPRAACEFRRVARRGGSIAVLWKYPDPAEPYEPLAASLLSELIGQSISTHHARTEVPELGDVRPLRIPWEVDWTIDRYVGFMASREYLRQRAGSHHEQWLVEFRRRLTALVGDRPFRERHVDELFLTTA